MLMDRYYRMVYGICIRMTGNAADADELAHDAFVEAYLKIGRVRDADRLSGWLKTLTLNVCRMWHRQRSKLVTVELDENMAAAVNEDDARYARMYFGMSKLSAAHRLVLVLHYFEGLSYDEIARFLDMPQGTVMSRLYRARNLLKEGLQQMTDDNNVPEIADIRFKEEIQAEIALLLTMDNGKPSTGKRLRIILEKSPERLIRLLEDSDSDMRHNLAVALPRLGDRALNDIVTASLSSHVDLAAHARSVLQDYVSRCAPVTIAGSHPYMASANAYVLLDMLTDSTASDHAKAEAIIEWMESCTDSAARVLLVNAMLCYYDEAFDLLLKRFISDGSGPSGWVRHALTRTGNRYCREVLNLLTSEREHDNSLGLDGFESIARSLTHPWISEASPERFAHELRVADRYPPLRATDIDGELLRRMTARTVELLGHQCADIRNSAINILGIFNTREYLDQIRVCMPHEDQSTRLTAIRALSGMRDVTIADELRKLAQNGDDAERVAAIKALGQMSVGDSVLLLWELTIDASKAVRCAAVAALGEIGSAEATSVLQDLMKSSDIAIRKTAAKALYGGTPDREFEPSETDRRLAEKRRRRSQPIAFISLDTAIRSLPEIRPYDESDLTSHIASVCEDYCTTRRCLIDRGFMTRSEGTYEFTELGACVWRVEHFIMREYPASTAGTTDLSG